MNAARLRAGLPTVLTAVLLAGCARGEEPPRDPSQSEKSVDKAAAEAEQEAKQIDAQFKGSPFGAVVDRLPTGKPPLRVRQYIVDEQRHRLTARVAPQGFLCRGGPDARRAAVAAFYRDANRRFRRRGIDDLDLVVAVLSDDIDNIRPLARVRKGKVALTSRGRASGRC